MLAMQERNAPGRAPLLIVVDASGGDGPREAQWLARGCRVRRLRVDSVSDALAQVERHAAAGADGPLVVWLSLEARGRDLGALLDAPQLARRNVAVVLSPGVCGDGVRVARTVRGGGDRSDPV